MAEKYIKIYYDWLESTCMLDHEGKGRLIDALISYARGESYSLTGDARIIFPMFQQQVNRDREAYQTIVDRNRSNGVKGGRPKKNPMGYLETQKSQDKDKDKDEDKDEDEDKDDCIVRGAGETPAPKRKRFTPPTVDDVRKYITEKGYNVDPERFVDHYTSVDWMRGNNRMKDWKAAVRLWDRTEQKKPSCAPIAHEQPLRRGDYISPKHLYND